MTYDQKCYELAEYFLGDDDALNTQENREDLAGQIQSTIEGFFAEKEGATNANAEHPTDRIKRPS